jgi:hypothetical protein
VQALVRRNIAFEAGGIVHVLGCGIEAGPRADMRHQVLVVIDVFAGNGQIEHVAIAENAGLAGLGQNDELVR